MSACCCDVLKPNSRTYNFVEISGYYLETVLRLEVYIKKPVSNHFYSRGGGVKSVSIGVCE
jgi:hypothetical protein